MQAAQRWAALAAGSPDAETLAWVAGVAARVLRANALPDANARRLAMLAAVELTGPLNTDAEAIRQLDAHVRATIRGASSQSETKRRKMLRDLIRWVCALPDATDEAVDARIRRAIQ
jgi:hypothetical protein